MKPGDTVHHPKYGLSILKETDKILHPGLGEECVYIEPIIRVSGNGRIILVEKDALTEEKQWLEKFKLGETDAPAHR